MVHGIALRVSKLLQVIVASFPVAPSPSSHPATDQHIIKRSRNTAPGTAAIVLEMCLPFSPFNAVTFYHLGASHL